MSALKRGVTIPADISDSDDALSEWLEASGFKQAFAVLGPEPGPQGARRVLAMGPNDGWQISEAAGVLARSDDFGLAWRRTGSSLVAWETLGREQVAGAWRELLWQQGFKAFVRVEIPLLADRAFECFLFTEQALKDSADAGRLAWSIMNAWPDLKAHVNLKHSPLSAVETQCLALAFEGLTAKETAERLGIPERRVTWHYECARGKLGAANTTNAIQYACWVGAI